MLRALEQVVLLKANVWFGEGARLAKRFSATGVPTFVLLDSEAEALSQWNGYDKDGFLASLGEALGKVREA